MLSRGGVHSFRKYYAIKRIPSGDVLADSRGRGNFPLNLHRTARPVNTEQQHDPQLSSGKRIFIKNKPYIPCNDRKSHFNYPRLHLPFSTPPTRAICIFIAYLYSTSQWDAPCATNIRVRLVSKPVRPLCVTPDPPTHHHTPPKKPRQRRCRRNITRLPLRLQNMQQ